MHLVTGMFLPHGNISFMSLAEKPFIHPSTFLSLSLSLATPPFYSPSAPPSPLSRLGFHFGGPSASLSADQGAFKVP